MKKLFYIEDTFENKISYYHMASFLTVLPLNYFFSEAILVSFTIHTFIHLRKEKIKQLFTKQILILVSLYLFSVLALLYSRNRNEGVALITSQLSFVLFPVLFTLNDLDLNKYKFPLLKIFGISCALVIIYLFYDSIATIRYFHLSLSYLVSKEFINQNFSQILHLHATYFSMYVALCLAAFILFFIKAKQGIDKIFYAFCIIVFSAGLVQMASRSVFIAVIIIIGGAFPFLLLKGKTRRRYILITMVPMLFAFMIIDQVPSFKERFSTELKEDLVQPTAASKIKEPRLLRWEAETELIAASPILGYGIGSEQQLLHEKFFSKKLYLSYEVDFNAHSQYLSFLITIGAIGLALYFLILYSGFKEGIRNRDILLVSFLIIIAVCCLAENILNINKGIFFYSFFISLFLVKNKTAVMTEPDGNHI